MLVSDMHYTAEQAEIDIFKSKHSSNVSFAAGDAFGYTQSEKIGKILEATKNEHDYSPIDQVLILGDLSIDDYPFRALPYNYCQKFKAECMDMMPCPSCALPGNHDSYPNTEWRTVFGNDRQFSFEVDGIAFIMLDTFNQTANDPSGAPYTGADVSFIKERLKRYSGKKIFICAHYIDTENDTDEFYNLVRENKEVVALFRGHTHISDVIYTEKLGTKPLVDIGGYAYMGKRLLDGTYTFSIFDES